jgi:hypothetical protein
MQGAILPPRRNRIPGYLRSAWPWAAIVPAYTGAAVVMLAPFSNYAAFSTAIGSGDPKLLAWTFAWTSHAILTGRSLFDANIFYPAHTALAFTEHHIGVGIFGLPLYALTGNAVLVFSVLKIAALALNGISMHFFAWRWLRSHGPALVAGLIFSVSSPRLLYIGHLPVVWNCWLPLMLIAAERWTATRAWKWLLAATLLFVLQALATWYLAVMAALALAVVAAWRQLAARVWLNRANGQQERTRSSHGRRALTTMAQLAAGGLLAAVIIWPLARPYLALSGYEETAPQVARRYAADIWSYVQPPEEALAGPVVTRVTGLQPRRLVGERVQYLGLLTVLLALVGSVRVIRLAVGRRSLSRDGQDLWWGGYFLVLAVVAASLALGPSISASSLMPFDVITRTPVLGMFRVPSRFVVLVILAVSGLAALGVSEVRRIGRRAGAVACVVLVPLLLCEWAIVPPPTQRPRADITPPIYQLVRSLDVHALVSLPCYRLSATPWLDADYMLYSTVHWRPIVNGYGRAQPPGQHWVVGAVDAFPGPGSALRMRGLGIDYVVLHAGRYPDRAAAILAEARTSDDFEQVARIGDDYLFRLLPKP